MIVLNQWQLKTCATYSVMAILLKNNVKFDLERLKTIRVPYMRQLEELFVKEGLVKKFIKLPTPKLVDLWLRRWEWLVTSTSRWDFTLSDNEGWVVEFDEKSQHFFVITEDVGDKWKCLNSWWEEWGEGWYFYINKSDFKSLFNPCRVILK